RGLFSSRASTKAIAPGCLADDWRHIRGTHVKLRAVNIAACEFRNVWSAPMTDQHRSDESEVMSETKDISRREFVRVAARAAAGASPAWMVSHGISAYAAGSEELAKLTMVEASRKVHSGEITCTELTEACLNRARAYNPKVNAYITIMNEEALAQARQLDVEARAGKFRGP